MVRTPGILEQVLEHVIMQLPTTVLQTFLSCLKGPAMSLLRELVK